MHPQDFILQRLEELAKPAENSSAADVVEAIHRRIVSKKFRKYSLTPGYDEHIHSSVEVNVKNSKPIKFTLPFGGYKLWRLDETPEVDWAELFTIIYYANWLKPIAEMYEPGVWFDFFSDDIIIERMNGVPKADTDAYSASFRSLLAFVETYLPKNLSFTFNRVAERYESQEEFEKDLEDKIAQVKEKQDGKPFDLTDRQIKMIEFNVKNRPAGSDWHQQVQLIHEGYSLVSRKRPYYRTSDKIMVTTTSFPNSITVGTTKSSVAKFWVGAGALAKDGEGYKELVLSPSQIESFKGSWQDMELPGLSSKNFHRLRVED